MRHSNDEDFVLPEPSQRAPPGDAPIPPPLPKFEPLKIPKTTPQHNLPRPVCRVEYSQKIAQLGNRSEISVRIVFDQLDTLRMQVVVSKVVGNAHQRRQLAAYFVVSSYVKQRSAGNCILRQRIYKTPAIMQHQIYAYTALQLT